MTTTVLAASSATLNVASVPRKAVVVPQREAHREVVAQEVVHREVVPHRVRLRETLAVVAVVPAVMRTTITHRAVVAEAAGDNGYI